MEEESFIMRMWRKVVTKETISYVIVGVLTTVVNLVAFHFLCKLDWNAFITYHDWNWNVLIANVIAWFVAVTFAYITNNLFVFGNGIEEKAKEINKIMKFFGARLVTLGVEELGLFVFVIWLDFPNMLVKSALAVVVIIVNYIFSKLYIFNNKHEKKYKNGR